jgi:hypothetical protein
MINNDGFVVLAKKEPVVATHIGVFNTDTAENTFDRYKSEIETFVILPEILQYEKKFSQAVLEGRTTIGCLVAPFGYGKTSTAINIWNSCENAGILTIPPFSCNSIAEMGHAIATAMTYRFESTNKPLEATRVRQVYDKYLISSAQKLAEEDANRYGINVDIALQSIEDKIQSGRLQLEASSTHLLYFLEQLVSITNDAGYEGLVIIVDEFQQLLGNINKGIITNFRTLIWGLQTRGELPLGFIITMDPDTERNLTDRGADILHRIRNHGLYLSFSNIYDREFPRELWSRYAESLGFTDNSSQIVDNATLEAVGQICERPDLSNGPRTVINVFQRIASLQMMRKSAYSPIDLINDFITGDIRFDGDRGKIASLVNEITSYDYIKRSTERIETIKLIAAFPRGCPPEVADRYSIHDTYIYLLDELRGEILVELPEGVALVDLQKVGKPQNKLNIILKKYWLQITEAEIISDKSLTYFAEYGVAPLFPEYISHQSGWKSETDRFLLTSTGGYYRAYEGTFFEEYPRRRIAVQVCFEIDDVVQPEDYVDAQFIFLIERGEINRQYLLDEINGVPTYIIPIEIHKQYNRHLPRDIRDIENYLSPVVLTPGVLISLLSYIMEQLPKIEGVSEQEFQRIMDIHIKLQEFLLTMSISDTTFEPYGIKIYSRGIQAFRDALFNILRIRYPDYQTIIVGSAWKRMLDQYQQALENINSTQRRGIEPYTKQKAEIALLFEQQKYAGFESYAKQYNGLLEIANWQGDSGSIIFHRHPHETSLIEVLSMTPSLSDEEVYKFSREQGYLNEETSYLIDFLLLRGYIERQNGNGRLVPASSFTQDELITLATQLVSETDFTQKFTNIKFKEKLEILSSNAKAILNSLKNNSTDLSEAQVYLLQYQRDFRSECKKFVLDKREFFKQKIEELYSFKALFDKPLPESNTSTFLDSHINGAQRTIQKNIDRASSRIYKIVNALRAIIERSLEIDADDFTIFKEYILRGDQQLKLADEEISELNLLLLQYKTHNDWVQLVDRLKRFGDMINAAGEITNTYLLEKNIQGIQSEIQQ